jgi:hypothetical protein
MPVRGLLAQLHRTAHGPDEILGIVRCDSTLDLDVEWVRGVCGDGTRWVMSRAVEGLRRELVVEDSQGSAFGTKLS